MRLLPDYNDYTPRNVVESTLSILSKEEEGRRLINF